MEWTPFDWYDSPLYYDLIFGEETEAEAEWLSLLYTLYAPPAPPSSPSPLILLEPACGSGRLLRALQLRGYTCTGFDLSPGAVRFAQQRCSPSSSSHPPCTVFQADLRSFASTHPHLVPPASVPFAHCLVSSVKYLLDPADVLAHFAAVHSVLCPLGVYVVALHLSDYSDPSPSIDPWIASLGALQVRATITCHPPHRSSRTEAVEVRMRVQEGDAATRYLVTREVMRTYDRGEAWRLLREVRGIFELVVTFDYGHAKEGRIDAPLRWPVEPTGKEVLGQGKGEKEVEGIDGDEEWPGWEGVEAVAVVLQRRYS